MAVKWGNTMAKWVGNSAWKWEWMVSMSEEKKVARLADYWAGEKVVPMVVELVVKLGQFLVRQWVVRLDLWMVGQTVVCLVRHLAELWVHRTVVK
jgi:hypothetical protein